MDVSYAHCCQKDEMKLKLKRRLRRQGGKENKNKGHVMREKKETRNSIYQ